MSEIVPKCPKAFCGFLLERKFLPTVPWRVEFWKIFKKIKKNQSSINAQKCSQKCANVFWTSSGAMCLKNVCPVFHAVHFRFSGLKKWFQFSGLKNKSSVFRNSTQQTFFLHSRHSQYTQSHFRFSGLEIMSSDSPNQKYEFRFPDLKKWIQFSDTILNRRFFALTPQSIYAIPFQIFWTENIEFRFPNIKIWVEFSGHKKFEFSFPDLFFEVET